MTMIAHMRNYYFGLVRMHEQRAHGLQSIGMVIKNTVFVTFMGQLIRSIVKQVDC